MSTDDDDKEYWSLVDAGRRLGFFVGRHKFFDPAMGGGEFFVTRRRQQGDPKKLPTIMKYATAGEITDFLNREAENYV